VRAKQLTQRKVESTPPPHQNPLSPQPLPHTKNPKHKHTPPPPTPPPPHPTPPTPPPTPPPPTPPPPPPPPPPPLPPGLVGLVLVENATVCRRGGRVDVAENWLPPEPLHSTCTAKVLRRAFVQDGRGETPSHIAHGNSQPRQPGIRRVALAGLILRIVRQRKVSFPYRRGGSQHASETMDQHSKLSFRTDPTRCVADGYLYGV